MIKLNRNNLNVFTIISLILILMGVIFYLYWGLRFGVRADVGIYSITIFFVLCGILGTILTLYENPDTSK